MSARIQNLEADLGAILFVRNRAGASLTPVGQRFVRHAKNLLLAVEQARHDVGLPNRYRASLRIGGRIALWEGFLPLWVDWMRRSAPDISIRAEIGFEENLMRRLTVQLLLANGGSCFLPIRMAQPFIDEGRLFKVSSGPVIPHPAYMVFPRESDGDALQLAAHGLRELARDLSEKAPHR